VRIRNGLKSLVIAGMALALAGSSAGCARPAATGSGAATGGAPAPAATGGGATGVLTIKGSDTMVNLAQAWAQAFKQANPGVNISVTGGGSGVGIAALLNKTTDIANSSREIKPDEIATGKKNGVDPVPTKVSLDGIAVAVNPANPVSKLTFKQLSDIYQGKITDWKDVGGKPGKIVVLSRESNSGTYSFFLENVIQSEGKDKKYAASALLMPSSQAIVDELAKNPGAIGYFGLGYLSAKVKDIPVSKTGAGPFVKPSIATVQDGSYPISRPLYVYTNGQPTGAAKAYIDFMLTKTGQDIVRQMDFVPLP
jgi:phosphate transport system substrate-binding protein